jgi:hypothetical protein
MKGRTGAAVINVASISGRSAQLAMSGQYGAAKAALIFDTERCALEFVPHRIRVNTVSPGSILVEGNGWDRCRLANPAHFEDYVRHGFPMDRLGTAQEVADVIVFLASSGPTGSMAATIGRRIRTRQSDNASASLLGGAEAGHRKAMADGCGCDPVPRLTRAYWLNGRNNLPIHTADLFFRSPSSCRQVSRRRRNAAA